MSRLPPLRIWPNKTHAWINLYHSVSNMSDLYGLEFLHNVRSLSDMVRAHMPMTEDWTPREFFSSPGLLLAAQACVIPFLIPPLLAGATVESVRCRDFMRLCHTDRSDSY